MPIQKETPNRIVKFGYHFDVIAREVVHQIRNPVALAYYAYFLTRPEDWVVRRNDLMARFNVGRDRHDNAMKELRSLGIVWLQDERDEQGKIIDRKIMVGTLPVDDLPKVGNHTIKSPKVGKPTSRENPQVGKTDHLQKNRLLTEEQIPYKVSPPAGGSSSQSDNPQNATPFQNILNLYHEILPDLPKVKVLTNKRKAAIRQRHIGIMERDLASWKSYFEAVAMSDFLMGRVDGKAWRADFDFLITEKATAKTLEGRYHA